MQTNNAVVRAKSFGVLSVVAVTRQTHSVFQIQVISGASVSKLKPESMISYVSPCPCAMVSIYSNIGADPWLVREVGVIGEDVPKVSDRFAAIYHHWTSRITSNWHVLES